MIPASRRKDGTTITLLLARRIPGTRQGHVLERPASGTVIQEGASNLESDLHLFSSRFEGIALTVLETPRVDTSGVAIVGTISVGLAIEDPLLASEDRPVAGSVPGFASGHAASPFIDKDVVVLAFDKASDCLRCCDILLACSICAHEHELVVSGSVVSKVLYTSIDVDLTVGNVPVGEIQSGLEAGIDPA